VAEQGWPLQSAATCALGPQAGRLGGGRCDLHVADTLACPPIGSSFVRRQRPRWPARKQRTFWRRRRPDWPLDSPFGRRRETAKVGQSWRQKGGRNYFCLLERLGPRWLVRYYYDWIRGRVWRPAPASGGGGGGGSSLAACPSRRPLFNARPAPKTQSIIIWFASASARSFAGQFVGWGRRQGAPARPNGSVLGRELRARSPGRGFVCLFYSFAYWPLVKGARRQGGRLSWPPENWIRIWAEIPNSLQLQRRRRRPPPRKHPADLL